MGVGIFGVKVVLVESKLYLFHGIVLMLMVCRSPEDVTKRVDRLIKDIRDRFHAPVIGKPKGQAPPGDVLLVAHGHILRAFAMRWAGKTLPSGPIFLLEAGGVGTLSYEHHNIDEPAILLGGAFMVDVAENAEKMGEGEKK
jgi:broad specificity phosphatase PhoE